MPLVTRVRITLEIGYDTLPDDSKQWVIREAYEFYKIGSFKMAKAFYEYLKALPQCSTSCPEQVESND